MVCSRCDRSVCDNVCVCTRTTPRFAIKLLEDLVFFVVDQTNSGQPVLEVVMSKANRERQKLMREQNILKQVGTGSTNT